MGREQFDSAERAVLEAVGTQIHPQTPSLQISTGHRGSSSNNQQGSEAQEGVTCPRAHGWDWWDLPMTACAEALGCE